MLPRQQPRRRRRFASKAAFLAWASCVLIASSSLMTAHLAALPTPTPIDPHVVAEVARSTNDDAANNVTTVVHVLASACGCSRNVIDQLARRGPIAGTHERILWVVASSKAGAASAPTAAIERGFEVEVLTASMLEERLGVIGAPTLIIANADRSIAYVGGYTRSKQSPVIHDVDLIKRVKNGERQIAALPVLGCAIDQKTAKRMDPLGLQ